MVGSRFFDFVCEIYFKIGMYVIVIFFLIYFILYLLIYVSFLNLIDLYIFLY